MAVAVRPQEMSKAQEVEEARRLVKTYAQTYIGATLGEEFVEAVQGNASQDFGISLYDLGKAAGVQEARVSLNDNIQHLESEVSKRDDKIAELRKVIDSLEDRIEKYGNEVTYKNDALARLDRAYQAEWAIANKWRNMRALFKGLLADEGE